MVLAAQQDSIGILKQQLQHHPDLAPVIQWHLALQYMKKDSLEASKRLWLTLWHYYRDSFSRSVIATNLGYIAYREGDKAGALRYFAKALRYDGSNKTAARNYEYLLKILPPPPPPPPPFRTPPITPPKENSGKLLYSLKDTLTEEQIQQLLHYWRQKPPLWLWNLKKRLVNKALKSPPI